MKTIKFKYLLPCALLGMMLGVASCVNDLERFHWTKTNWFPTLFSGTSPWLMSKVLLRFMQVWPSVVTAGVIPIRMW